MRGSNATGNAKEQTEVNMEDQAIAQSPEERIESLLEAEDPIEEDGVDSRLDDAEPEEPEEEAEDSQEETEAPQKLKLTRNGEEIEVDIEEAKNLAQQGYDYTKKTQEVAEQRKQVEMYAQAIKAQEQAIQQQAALQQAFIKDIAKVESINERIAQFEGLDWSALSDQDPVQAQKLYIEYQQLQNKRTQSVNEIQQKQSQLQQHTQRQDAMRLEQARVDLLKAFPNWNADIAKELRESTKAYGYTDEELSMVTDPRLVKILHDASQYRKLQANKGTVTNKVQGKPAVVKPGAKDTKRAADSSVSKMRQELKRSGKPEHAAKLFEKFL
jgi:hypothetical protein